MQEKLQTEFDEEEFFRFAKSYLSYDKPELPGGSRPLPQFQGRLEGAAGFLLWHGATCPRHAPELVFPFGAPSIA